jgi:EAL domain-containing protein (putative c-di-GMP-specific phosphodiesterase class I)
VAVHGASFASFTAIDFVRIDMQTDDLAALAHELRAAGVKIIAGPARSLDEAQFLRTEGADFLWGPLFGDAVEAPQTIVRPMPAAWRSEPASPQPSAMPGASPLQRALAALDKRKAELERLRR